MIKLYVLYAFHGEKRGAPSWWYVLGVFSDAHRAVDALKQHVAKPEALSYAAADSYLLREVGEGQLQMDVPPKDVFRVERRVGKFFCSEDGAPEYEF